LVGVASEALGAQPLGKMLPKLNCEQIRPLIAALERIEDTRVAWKEILENEKIFARHEMRRTHVNPIARLTLAWQTRGVTQKAEDKHNRAIASVRLLTTEMALRCYQAEQG